MEILDGAYVEDVGLKRGIASNRRSPRAHLDEVGMLGFVSFDINQPSLPTPFYSALGVYFCLYGPFNCISFLNLSFSPDIVLSG